MNCVSPDGKPLCRNGQQRRFRIDQWETVPCVLCNQEQWQDWAKGVTAPPKPAKPIAQETLFPAPHAGVSGFDPRQ